VSESRGSAVVNADRFAVVSMSRWMFVLIACRSWAVKGLCIVRGRCSVSTSWMRASREATAAGGREKLGKVGILMSLVVGVGGGVGDMAVGVVDDCVVSGLWSLVWRCLREMGLVRGI
jgi:hypothetical protein